MGGGQRLRVLLLVLLAWIGMIHGQGLLPTPKSALGAESVLRSLLKVYRRTTAFQVAYRKAGPSRCKGAGTLCSSVTAKDEAMLLMATSPQVYDSRDPTHTGGYNYIPAVGDQESCTTCVAFAVTAVAHAAMASIFQVNATSIARLSNQQFHFCLSSREGEERGCKSPMTMQDGVEAFVNLHKNGRYLIQERCAPYKTTPDPQRGYCFPLCDMVDLELTKGRFWWENIASAEEVMQKIRTYGAVVTRFNIFSDFKDFFKRNPRGVYHPGHSAQQEEDHAVVLVGYNLEQNFWLVRNSWGPNFADDGYFRVAMNATTTGIANDDDTFALAFSAFKPLPRPPTTPSSKKDCVVYKGEPTDYVSKVARLFGVPVQDVLWGNQRVIKEPNMYLGGINLELCGVKPLVGAKPKPPFVESQFRALLAIREMVDNKDALIEDWSPFKRAYCEWHGVSCNDAGLVVSISPDGKLGGFLPPFNLLKRLPALKVVGLGNNMLQGELPSQYSELTDLQELYLYENRLTGTLPQGFTALTGLVRLSLARNQLSGPLPASWGSLARLKLLYLYENKLSGTLPAAWSGMVTIDNLYLGRNQLWGPLPASWGSLAKMEQLWLGHNKLSGTLPAAWSGMVAVREMDLGTNNLTGPLPASWGAWAKVESLSLGDAGLSGTLPAAWSGMVSMQQFSLTGSSSFRSIELSGSLPASWGSLSRLWRLNLIGNKLSRMLPAEWSGMVAMKELDLRFNQLSGPLPLSWGALTKLEIYLVGGNELNGTLPASWSSMVAMESLEVAGNQLSGPLPASWGSLAKMKHLDLCINKLSGTLPVAWSGMKAISNLDLDRNQLSGPLPASWGSLAKMEKLNLFENKLSGTLPAAWSGMVAVREMDLDTNQLSGPLPASWGSLAELMMLYLYENKLSGTLPAAWSGMVTIDNLYLGRNQLWGPLPASWGSLAKMEVLHLYENKLSGTLPAAWSGMVALEDLGLSNNQFSGFLPAAWKAMTRLTEIALRNNPNLVGCLPATWKGHVKVVAAHSKRFPIPILNPLENTKITGFCK